MARRCCRSRRSRPSAEPLHELRVHRPDVIARVLVLRLVLDADRPGVADALERANAAFDVDDSVPVAAGVVGLSFMCDVLQVNVDDPRAELFDRAWRVVALRAEPAG